MEKPNYVLRFNEMHLAPKDNFNLIKWLQFAVIIIWMLAILSAIIFGQGLFNGISKIAIVILLGVSIKIISANKRQRIKRIFELRFYDEYIVAYRPETLVPPKKRRVEYLTMYYKDIEKCHYRTGAKRISFYGGADCKYYYYNADGTLPAEPSHHKTSNNGMFYFYVDAEPNIDFVAEIEQHSPIKVIITNN